jgi:hypothetical protein
VYPVLLYLLARVLFAAFRPRRPSGPLVPHVPLTLLVVLLVFLTAFRIGLNVADSNVIDVGYAGVIGADRIADGHQLYGDGFSADVERGDTYGPVTYLLYVPFEQALPWSGRWDDLPAAHGAAIAFDLLALGGLLLLGRRMRPGRDGTLLGVALGYAWVAYPYTTFVLESNSNDTLVAVACVGALLAATLARDRVSAAAAGLAIGLGAAAKFVTVALAPLFARRSPVVLFGTLLLVVALAVVPFIPDGGVRELYDRTVGYQASRPSPFSIWGQVDSLGLASERRKGAAAGLALLAAFRPSTPDLRQTAAMGAAILIAVELTATHWFYLNIVWFVPFVLVALLAAHATPPGPSGGAGESARRCSRDARRQAAETARPGGALARLSSSRPGGAHPSGSRLEQRARDDPVRVPHLRAARPGRWACPTATSRFEYPPLARPAIALPGLRAPPPRASGGRSPCGRSAARRPWSCSAAPGPAHGRRCAGARCSPPRHAAPLRRALRTHFDLFPVALVLARAPAARPRPPRAGFAVLGVAVMTKVFPIVIAPVAIAWLVARGRRRDAWQGALVCAAVMAAIAVRPSRRRRTGARRGRATSSTARSRSRARPPSWCSAWMQWAQATRRA